MASTPTDGPYPSWRYHAEKDPVIVNSHEEDVALGAGWADTPADFEDDGDTKLHRGSGSGSTPGRGPRPDHELPDASRPTPHKK